MEKKNFGWKIKILVGIYFPEKICIDVALFSFTIFFVLLLEDPLFINI